MPIFAYVLARFSEPSSYAGLGAVLALLGVHFSDSDLGQIAQFFAAGCGLVALLLKERGIIPMLALAVLATATLGACTGSSALTSSLTPAQIASGTQQALATTQAILTTTQQAMCEAQAAANLASTVASGAGDTAAASEASKASAAAGAGCTWTNPAPASSNSAASQ
jgi:hypothetical protein